MTWSTLIIPSATYRSLPTPAQSQILRTAVVVSEPKMPSAAVLNPARGEQVPVSPGRLALIGDFE
jgi:hypothetical protein